MTTTLNDLPRVGLGTWQTFDISPTHYPERRKLLAEFVELGGQLVDSSPMYGRAEQAVGAVRDAADSAQQLFLATKVWTTGRQAGVRQMEQSFERLRTPVVDLMQVHNLVDVHVHLETLREWQREGRVRYVGVTHYTASAHQQVAAVLERETVDCLQINYSAAEREAEARLLPMALERGIPVIVNRPFAEGRLLQQLARRRPPSMAAELECDSWSALLLKFVLSHPAVTCAIPATANLAHLRANMAAGRDPLPDQRQREAIAAAVAAGM